MGDEEVGYFGVGGSAANWLQCQEPPLLPKPMCQVRSSSSSNGTFLAQVTILLSLLHVSH